MGGSWIGSWPGIGVSFMKTRQFPAALVRSLSRTAHRLVYFGGSLRAVECTRAFVAPPDHAAIADWMSRGSAGFTKW